MKISLNWLKEYVDIDIPVKEFLDRMTMLGLEVEECVYLGETMENVVAGRIDSIERHPDADKLVVCSVDVGTEKLQIVTGASNVFVGMMVPVALHGSHLPNGVKIKKGKLRGVESYGMLCSGEELCIDESVYEGAEIHGILPLDPSVKIGTDMRDVLGLNDYVIDFKATANRPDCLSGVGLAREAAVALGKPACIDEKEVAGTSGDISEYVSVRVDAPDLCPRYMARAVKNVKIGRSPDWLRYRLKASGIRPINNIVDITNLVMLEYGQPMHAFDWSDIRGQQIVVRRAEKDEILTTLDSKEHILSEDMLVIADAEGAIGLAGIMGGENSEIKNETTTVVFESAAFRRESIRRTSRALGIRTESSGRYERGIDTVTPEKALARACALVEMLGCGEVVKGNVDIYAEKAEERTVTADPNKINGLLGIEVPTEKMLEILNLLGIESTLSDGKIVAKVPYYRNDIEGMADLAEEVLRVYGYDNITHTDMTGILKTGKKCDTLLLKDTVSEMLASFGLDEIMTYSFISGKAFDLLGLDEDDELRRAIKIQNPLGEDYSVMRTTLAHNMLQVLSVNINRKNPEGGFYEVQHVYLTDELPLKDLPVERSKACIGMYGAKTDFYDIKGVVEALLEKMHVDGAEYEVGGKCFMHPGRKALIKKGDTVLGYLGQVHPDIADNYDIAMPVYIAELDLKALDEMSDKTFTFETLPKYPRVERDLAIIVDEGVTVGTIASLITAKGGKLLENCELFDIYRSAQIGENKKSVAFTLRFRSDDHTLTEDEINGAFNKIMSALESEIDAKLR